jgi:hypothetical protein
MELEEGDGGGTGVAHCGDALSMFVAGAVVIFYLGISADCATQSGRMARTPPQVGLDRFKTACVFDDTTGGRVNQSAEPTPAMTSLIMIQQNYGKYIRADGD